MPRTTEIPVDELEGRELDLAVHEEVYRRPGYSVDPRGVDAVVSMSGHAESGGLRSKWFDEAKEFDDYQKCISAHRYSSDEERARELDTYMRDEKRSRQVRRRYLQLRYGGERQAREQTDANEIQPEEVARAALRAVRDV